MEIALSGLNFPCHSSLVDKVLYANYLPLSRAPGTVPAISVYQVSLLRQTWSSQGAHILPGEPGHLTLLTLQRPRPTCSGPSLSFRVQPPCDPALHVGPLP